MALTQYREIKIRIDVIFWKYDNYVILSSNNSPKIKYSRIV